MQNMAWKPPLLLLNAGNTTVIAKTLDPIIHTNSMSYTLYNHSATH
jgi:hypothetical protein